MSNIIKDAFGNIEGFRSGSGGSFAGGGASGSWDYNPTTYNSADVKKTPEELERIRTLRYPASGGNNHYVRFTINISEESKLIKENLVGAEYVDYSEQNRAFRNQTSEDAISSAGAIAGAAVVPAVAVGAVRTSTKLGAAAVRKLFASKATGNSSGIALGGAAVAGVVGGAYVGSEVASAASDYFKMTKRLKKLIADITLYTPANIRATYNFSYDTPTDLLVDLAQSDNFEALKSGLSAMGSALASPVTAVTEGAGAAIADVKSGASAIGSVGRIVAASIQPVSILTRTTVNKKRDVMFQHVGNRTFVFEYTFAPRSVSEAKDVDDIIFMFKYFAHPEMLEGFGNFLYLYPAEFDIEYGMRVSDMENQDYNSPNKYLNKISSCVLTGIDVNYAPNGNFQSLEKGEPMITTVQLVFQEIETLHRARIAKGY